MNINLIPAAAQRQQHQRKRLRLWAGVLTVAAGILTIPIGLDWSRKAHAKELRIRAADLDRTQTQVKSEWNTVFSEVEETQAHIERAEALRSKRAWSALVTLIAANVPADVWLTTIATDPARPSPQAKQRAVTAPAPAKPGATKPKEESLTIDAPTKIKIEGYAPHAAEPLTLVRSLQATNVFKTVSLLRSSLEAQEDGAYFHFSLLCEW